MLKMHYRSVYNYVSLIQLKKKVYPHTLLGCLILWTGYVLNDFLLPCSEHLTELSKGIFE